MFAPLVCRKCAKRRLERREIIQEIVDTEEKFAGDLRILLDEFYKPMLVAGLLAREQVGSSAALILCNCICRSLSGIKI